MAKKKSAATAECHCHERGEVFCYMGRYFYDVDKAWQLAREGHEPVEIEEDSLKFSVDMCEVNEHHLAHVNPERPGLIAHVQYRTPGGELVKGHALIDGNHRAIRCLREGRPFRAYVLTEEESLAVLLRSPKGSPQPRRRRKVSQGGSASNGRADEVRRRP